MHTGYYFTSTRFAIDPTEDEETNPGRYGKAVALWLGDTLDKLGYQTDVFPEDWGWRVLCDFTDDYQLFIGCGNVDGNVDSMTDIETINHDESGTPPEGSDVVWHVFPQIEARPFRFATLLKKWRGQLDLNAPLEKLNQDLNDLLNATQDIQLCDEP